MSKHPLLEWMCGFLAPFAWLRRKKKLKPGGFLKRRMRLKAVSAKQRRKNAEWAKLNKAAGIHDQHVPCEIKSPVCWGRATEGHHLKKRGQCGPNISGNRLNSCGPCNTYIEDHPNWAHEHGFTIKPWEQVPGEGEAA